MAVGTGLALVLGLGYSVLATSMLGLRSVELRGAQTVSSAQVRSAVGVRQGFPLARVRLDVAAAAVERIPAVRSATVTRDWPHGLRVSVVEREPVGIVADGTGWSYVDRTGVAFAPAPAAETKDPLGHPVLRTRRGDLGALRSAAAVVGGLPQALLLQVARVDAQSVDSVSLALRSGKTVLWGSPDRSVRKATVLAALRTSVTDGRTYDVSAPDAPTVR